MESHSLTNAQVSPLLFVMIKHINSVFPHLMLTSLHSFTFMYNVCVCVCTCMDSSTKQQMGEAGRGNGSPRQLWRCQTNRGCPLITYDPAPSPHTEKSKAASGPGHPMFLPRGEAWLEARDMRRKVTPLNFPPPHLSLKNAFLIKV